MTIVPGQYALYRGSWAYVVAVQGDEVWLSGWRGIKTTVAKLKDITTVKDKP